MAVTIEQMQAAGKNSIAMLEKWMQLDVPESLSAALNGDWLTSAQRGAEGILGTVTERELAEMSKRVMTIEKANKLLQSLEEDMVLKYAVGVNPVLQRAIYRATVIPIFVVTHLGDIYRVVLPNLGSLLVGFTGTFQTAVVGTFARYFHNLDPSNQYWEDTYERTSNELDTQTNVMIFMMASAVASAAYFAVEHFFEISYSMAAIHAFCLDSVKVRDYGEDSLRANILPQRDRVFARRRKRAR